MKKQLSVLSANQSKVSDLPQSLRVLGIDLGTTNSTITEVIWELEKTKKLAAKCLEVEQETLSGLYTHVLIPSFVAIYNGQEWIGEGAKRLYARAPEFGLELTKNIFLECKNDIGSRRTYHRAPEGYRSASQIGSKILRYLETAAEKDVDLPVKRTVISVPASFQAAQRIDTVKAAQLAGIPVSSGDLIDEPVAAFLDYLMSHMGRLEDILAQDRHLCVFDFGGGTCDIAVFSIKKGASDLALNISPLSVSRYHRLGGGDIDRAILYEVLLPQLFEQNGLDANFLTYEEKKNSVEPALLGIAEALKVGLCNEISRLKSFDQYNNADKDEIVKKQPGLYTCKIGSSTLRFQSPFLTCAEFEDILEPFLDRELLYARETEYRLTCSIFAPIQDALDRCGLDASSIDLCLLVGGSSLIPQVADAVSSFFEQAEVIRFADPDSILVAVARGAAYHAFALEAFGRSVFEVVASDRLSIRTAGGTYELIPRNARLPYPSPDTWAETCDLKIPVSSTSEPVPLRVEFVAGDTDQERSLFIATWNVPAPVNAGDKLKLEYRLDENQVLEFRLTLADEAGNEPFRGSIENPLSNVVNPHMKRLEIQETEESLRLGKVPKKLIPDTIVEIARGYAELRQHEKAISYLKQALRLLNRPDGNILNLLGVYSGECGDHVNEEKFYRESAKSGNKDCAFFNLALAYYRKKEYEKAWTTMDDRLSDDPDGPGLTLAAQIAEARGDTEMRDIYLETSLGAYDKLRSLSDWELGWFHSAASMAGKSDLLETIKAEKRRRKRSGEVDDLSNAGLLPEISNVPRSI